MESLIKILTSNIITITGSIIVILCFIAPGYMFIFIWDREKFMSMKMDKLLMLSFSITWLAFIPNSFIGIIFTFYDIFKEQENISISIIVYSIMALLFTVIEILSCIFLQMISKDKIKQIKKCILIYGVATFICIIIFLMIKILLI